MAVAKSAQGAIVAVENGAKQIYGLQYHPEVVHSVRGKETIARFLHDICGLKSDWKMENVLEMEMAKIRAQASKQAETMIFLHFARGPFSPFALGSSVIISDFW